MAENRRQDEKKDSKMTIRMCQNGLVRIGPIQLSPNERMEFRD